MPSQRIDPGKVTRARARDALLRRTRTAMVAISAVAVALSGALSAVAAQAFKGHQAGAARPAARSAAPRPVQVPTPERIPAIAGQPAPLQPPAAPPAAATPEPAAPAPAPQVSGGS
jgi:hypothetical protein